MNDKKDNKDKKESCLRDSFALKEEKLYVRIHNIKEFVNHVFI